MTDPEDENGTTAQPMIRFGGEWLPAHEVWDKMETATVVMETIQRFNENYPGLASSGTRNVVPLVKKRLKEIEMRMPRGPASLPDLGPVASDLLKRMSPERTLDVLEQEHGANLEMMQLIQLAGEEAYLDALTREGADYRANRISDEQTARLWNDFARPPPGGGLWTARKVAELLGDL